MQSPRAAERIFMNICVLAGSPKGKYSITLQTVRFLEKKFPEDSFEILHVGQRINGFEKDMSSARAAIERSELMLFCYPVYTFIAPYQLHRFIELLKGEGLDLSEKAAAQITTSKHFYDVTAHKYIEENCHDLGMKYLGGLSADMEDLLEERGRREAIDFWNLIRYRYENGLYIKPVLHERGAEEPYCPSGAVSEKTEEGVITIVADLAEGDEALASMVEDFRAQYPSQTRLVNLCEYPFSGGCLGCFGCAVTGKCVYKDGFDEFLRGEIQTSRAIVYAFRIKDHSMGSRMKLYDDRQFCNGHRTVTEGMPMGYIVAGDLSAEENLRMIIEGRGEVGGNFVAGIATDKDSMAELVKTLKFALDTGYKKPSNFLGVGGMKIFRDLIWLMRGMMKADHKFYKSHGLYDFPQKRRGTVIKMKLVGMLISSPKIKAKMGNKMNEGMIAPYEKVLKNI